MGADNTLKNTIQSSQRLERAKQGHIDPYSDPGKTNRNTNTNGNGGNTQYVPMEIDAGRTKGRPLVKCYGCRKLGHIRKNCRSGGKTILRRPSGPPRIRAADLGEEGVSAPDPRIEQLEEQLAAQQDAIQSMYKMIQEERKEKVMDF